MAATDEIVAIALKNTVVAGDDASESRARGVIYIKEKSMNKEYRPMLATLVDKPFDSAEWVYETKWDGFRLIAEAKRGSVRLFSRNGIEVTARYPAIAQALRAVTVAQPSR